MRKIKYSLILGLALVCISFFITFFGCGDGYQLETEPTVAQKVVYTTGSSVDLYSLFETKDGYAYSFTVKNNGNGEVFQTSGRSFYAKLAGDYVVECVGIKGKVKRTGSANLTVSDTLPYMMVKNNTLLMNYKSSIDLQMLIANVKLFITSDTAITYSVDKVEYIKNAYVDSGETYDLSKGPTENGFYTADGKVHFDGEGVYIFNLIAKNAGGSVSGKFPVTVKESLSAYVDLGELTFNEKTNVATWDAIKGASYYRVKVDYENVITDKTSLDISEYLVEEAGGFQCFDLAVIPLDQNKKEIKYEDSEGYSVNGMKVIKGLIIAPEEYGDIILGNYTKVNKDTGIVTTQGATATVSLGRDGIMAMDNGYFAWKGDYGLNTYVSFEFSGNNIPNVCFFADNISKDMTYGGKMVDSEKNKGMLVMSGVYGTYSTGSYRLAMGDTVAVFGPHRLESGWSNPNNRYFPSRNDGKIQYNLPVYLAPNLLAPSPYTLLTQEGLRNDDSGRTYRYVVGTYGEKTKSGTKIFLDVKLYDVANDANAIYDITVDTKMYTYEFTDNGEKFVGGNILVFAPSKEESSTSNFKISKPYYVEPTENGTYVLNGAYPGNVNYVNFVSDNGNSWNTGSKAFDGIDDTGYGLGTYMDIKFTGNNLPILTLFADDITQGIAEGAKLDVLGAGITLLNGIVNNNNGSEPRTTEQYSDLFRIYGPYKYGARDVNGNKIYDQNTQTYCIWARENDSVYKKLYLLGQDYLKEGVEYRLLLGVIENKGNICLDMQFIDQTEKEQIFSYCVDTKVSVSAMKELLGISNGGELKGYILANGAYKGKDVDGHSYNTVFSIDFSDKKIPVPSDIHIEPEVIGGEYTVKGAAPANTSSGTAMVSGQQSSSVSLGSYGLGTYLDVDFTGNNLPVISFLASENTNYIATNNAGGERGAGILILNGYKNANGSEEFLNELRVFGPYKYGSKIDASWNGAYHYAEKVEGWSGNKTYPNLYKLTQSELQDGVDYKLIVGVIESNGNIALDMTFVNMTTKTVIFSYLVDTTITLSQMRTALGIGETDEIKGYVIFNGAYKGKDADNNVLSTTFNVTLKETKIDLPADVTE